MSYVTRKGLMLEQMQLTYIVYVYYIYAYLQLKLVNLHSMQL